MKNPNGYGTVTKLSGSRRKPWVVREGLSGRQHPVGYAKTREEALIMLADYNRSPWDVEAENLTLGEIFDLWLKRGTSRLSKTNITCLKSAYNHCKKYERVKYSKIKSYNMQECIDECGYGYATQAAIKNLWRHLDNFALEIDAVTKCYSKTLVSAPIPETTRTVFTEDEIQRLWDNKNYPWADSVLFLIYTGFRISEMLSLKVSDTDFEAGTMKGGVKTEAGKNRIVPIHSKILPFVEKRAKNSKSGYLFEVKGKPIPSVSYRTLWSDVMNTLKMNHKPHECRHTFRSKLDSAGANKVCIDKMMGHKSPDTGERVYTHKNIEELKMNIELID